MYRYFLVLFLTLCVNAQVIVNEQFNNFVLNPSKYNPVSMWVFNAGYHTAYSTGKTVLQDVVSTNDLTASGGFDWQNSFTAADPFYSGSNILKFDGTDDYLYILEANATALNPGTGDFSIVSGFYLGNKTGTQRIVSKYDGTPTGYLVGLYIGTDATLYNTITNFGGSPTLKETAMPVDTAKNYINVYSADRSANIVSHTNLTKYAISISALSSVDLNAGNFVIGASPTFGFIVKMNPSFIAYFNRALTDKEAREIGNLAYDWYSKNGKVVRGLNPAEFYQTFFDTIGVPLSNVAIGNGSYFKLTFDAKSNDANKTVNTWIGSKTSVASITATSSWSTYTVDFLGLSNLATTDTLWFSSNSISDTVSIDNVRFEVIGNTVNRRVGGGFGGWIGW
jgi:hypothetical protein